MEYYSPLGPQLIYHAPLMRVWGGGECKTGVALSEAVAPVRAFQPAARGELEGIAGPERCLHRHDNLTAMTRESTLAFI